MIFCHKPYYNPNKKKLSDICPKPNKLCKAYKLYNAKQLFFKEHRKKFRNQILKLLNYKHLLIEKKTLILKKNQINFVKNQKKIYVFYLCVISPS